MRAPHAMLLLGLLSTPAWAWDSTIPIDASGTKAQGIDVEVPLGFAVAGYWIGGVLKLTGEARPVVTMSSDATLSWGDDLGPGVFRHEVAPIETALDLDTDAAYGLALQIRAGDAGGAVLLGFDVVGDSIVWKEELGVEDGALLPGDDPEQLEATEVGASFPGVGFNLGSVVGISLTQALTSEIHADAEVRGIDVRTAVDGVVSSDEAFDVADGTPGLDVAIQYTCEVDLRLAYTITKNPVLTLNLGIPIPITIPLKDTSIEAISGTVEVEAIGHGRHAFGRADTAEVGGLTAVEVGESKTFEVTVENGGSGPLDVEVIGVSGPDGSMFDGPDTPWQIPANDRADTAFTFAPTSATNTRATLVLGTSDPWNPQLDLTLRAIGTVDGVAPDPDDGDPQTTPDYEACGCAQGRGPASGAFAGLFALVLATRRRRA